MIFVVPEYPTKTFFVRLPEPALKAPIGYSKSREPCLPTVFKGDENLKEKQGEFWPRNEGKGKICIILPHITKILRQSRPPDWGVLNTTSVQTINQVKTRD